MNQVIEHTEEYKIMSLIIRNNRNIKVWPAFYFFLSM